MTTAVTEVTWVQRVQGGDGKASHAVGRLSGKTDGVRGREGRIPDPGVHVCFTPDSSLAKYIEHSLYELLRNCFDVG